MIDRSGNLAALGFFSADCSRQVRRSRETDKDQADFLALWLALVYRVAAYCTRSQ